jgi:hypothetical protein
LWKRQLGTPDNDTASGVATDGKGHVYIAGYTQIYNGCGPACDELRAWVAKYSEAGALLWQRQLPKAYGNLNLTDGVATDHYGNAYVIGHEGIDLGWMAKYSTAGALLWQKEIGSLGSSIFPRGVALDGKGDMYIAGISQSESDAAIVKYSAAGALLWKQQLPNARAAGVATDDNGGVYLIGYTWGSQQGFADAFIAKYSAAGAVLWNRQLGTPTTDMPGGVATDHDGHVYIAGSTDGSLGGPNQGSADAFLAKYSQRR